MGFRPGSRGDLAARSRRLAIVFVLGAAGAASGWLLTDRLEQDNDFCNACHLSPEVPLHIDLRRDFDAPVPTTLAAAHRVAGTRRRPDGEFRCIDCHGGHSLPGRLRVKVLAAKDGFWYALGLFEEPTEMRWPLWDEDCGKCHPTFDEIESESWQSPRFHELAVHNVDLGVGCVECHFAHEPGGNPGADFVHADRIRSQCARCHPQFQEGET